MIAELEPHDVDEAQQQDDLDDEKEARQDPCNLQGMRCQRVRAQQQSIGEVRTMQELPFLPVKL